MFFYVLNSNSVQGETTRVGDWIDSEPDQHETDVKSVEDAHDHSVLGKISQGGQNDNPRTIVDAASTDK